MEKNESKWTAKDVVAVGTIGISVLVAAPVVLAAWALTKIAEKLGVDNPPTDWDPSDPTDPRNSNY